MSDKVKVFFQEVVPHLSLTEMTALIHDLATELERRYVPDNSTTDDKLADQARELRMKSLREDILSFIKYEKKTRRDILDECVALGHSRDDSSAQLEILIKESRVNIEYALFSKA